MADRIAVPLPDGRWLSLDRDAFDLALAAGADLSPTAAPVNAPSGPRLLSSSQLATLLSIPATWLEEAARRDEIPHVQIGKYVRFDADSVVASLDPRIASARVSRKPMIQQRRNHALRVGNAIPRMPEASQRE